MYSGGKVLFVCTYTYVCVYAYVHMYVYTHTYITWLISIFKLSAELKIKNVKSHNSLLSVFVLE